MARLGLEGFGAGRGGIGGRAQALDDWTDVAQPGGVRGMRVGLLAVLTVAGADLCWAAPGCDDPAGGAFTRP